MDPDVRRYGRLPGGHQEGWADAFYNVIRDIYELIVKGTPSGSKRPTVATFDDGLRAVRIVEAMLASTRGGSVWTAI